MKGWGDYFHYNFALLFLTFTFYLSWCRYGTTFLINLVSACLSVSSLWWPELSVNLITKRVLFWGMMGLVTVVSTELSLHSHWVTRNRLCQLEVERAEQQCSKQFLRFWKTVFLRHMQVIFSGKKGGKKKNHWGSYDYQLPELQMALWHDLCVNIKSFIHFFFSLYGHGFNMFNIMWFIL